MTNEEMDRAIAEAVGWSAIEDRSAALMMADGFSVWGYPPKGAVIGKKVPIPRYSTDLNAMHEAEKAALNCSTMWLEFACNILSVLEAADMSVADGMTCVLQATATQRAQAFLRTIGKYSDATHPLP